MPAQVLRFSASGSRIEGFRILGSGFTALGFRVSCLAGLCWKHLRDAQYVLLFQEEFQKAEQHYESHVLHRHALGSDLIHQQSSWSWNLG